MATFTKRGNAWLARVRHKGVYKARTFKTKSEAKAWAYEIETAINNGSTTEEPIKTKFIDIIDRYASEISTTKKGERWEVIRITKFKRDLPFIHMHIADITTPMISIWRDQRIKQIQASSVNREMNLLSAIFEAARREWQLISTNPVRDSRRPKQPEHRERIFNQNEIDQIINELSLNNGIDTEITKRSQIIAMAFLFSIETGMRRGEITGLTWNHVNINQKFVSLPKTKNGDSREVPLSPTASTILKKLTEFKKPFDIDKDVLSTMFRKTCIKAGISNAHFHDARATAITRLSKKLDVLELARMIGHRDIKSLMIYYRESAETIAKKLI